MVEEELVEQTFNAYLNAGEDCDIEAATFLITNESKQITRFTCSNMANEMRCSIGRDYEILVDGGRAILYFIPYKVGHPPYFFEKEDGIWKFDFLDMAFGIVFYGTSCDAAWGWRDPSLREEFCSYFPEGECPDDAW